MSDKGVDVNETQINDPTVVLGTKKAKLPVDQVQVIKIDKETKLPVGTQSITKFDSEKRIEIHGAEAEELKAAYKAAQQNKDK